GKAYQIDPVTSVVRTTFTPTIVRSGGAFGFALGAVGSVVAIGEPAPGVTSGSGRVYLFTLAPQSSATGPATGPQRAQPPALPPAGCVSSATAASVRCRLLILLATLREMGLQPMAKPLRRALHEVHRADTARGSRRARAAGRALRGVGEFTRSLDGGRVAVSAEVRDGLVTAARSVEADRRTLSGSTPEP